MEVSILWYFRQAYHKCAHTLYKLFQRGDIISKRYTSVDACFINALEEVFFSEIEMFDKDLFTGILKAIAVGVPADSIKRLPMRYKTASAHTVFDKK